jgi:hypothetical protein
LPSNVVTSVAIENHIKWVGTALTGGMAKFNDTNWIIYNTINSGLSSNEIRYISLDSFNNKWICTDFGGLCKFNSTSNNWTVYNTTNSGIPSDFVMTIKNTQNNIKLISVENEGLTIFNDITWQIFNTSNSPIPSNTISRIETDKFNNVWISTANGLAIYNSNGIIGIENEITMLPDGYKIYQNYPNPFNPVTTIKYELPKEGMITFKIYDILGKEIYSINEFRKAGIHEIKFDGSNFASGVYFYRIETGSFIDTKKMVLVK